LCKPPNGGFLNGQEKTYPGRARMSREDDLISARPERIRID